MSKHCFVIAPIGPDASDVRLRSDQVLRHVIEPAAVECGYLPLRADAISELGIITSQVIQHIINDPLVIADLTGRNPNVFYELAIRHAIRKPVVQLIGAGEELPFDIAATRTIFFDHRDLDSAARARDSIIKQIRAVEANALDVDTPVSSALRVQLFAESDNALEQSSVAILAALQDLQTELRELRSTERTSAVSAGLVQELALLMAQVVRMVPSIEGGELHGPQLAQLREHLRALTPLLRLLCADAGIQAPGVLAT